MLSPSTGKQEQEVAGAVDHAERGNIEQLSKLAQKTLYPVPVCLRV